MLKASQFKHPPAYRPIYSPASRKLLKVHVDYETAKRLGQEMTAPVHRGLYLVSLTRAEYENLRERS